MKLHCCPGSTCSFVGSSFACVAERYFYIKGIVFLLYLSFLSFILYSNAFCSQDYSFKFKRATHAFLENFKCYVCERFKKTYLMNFCIFQGRARAGGGTWHRRGRRRGLLSQHSYSSANNVPLSFLRIKCYRLFFPSKSCQIRLSFQLVEIEWCAKCSLGAFIGEKIGSFGLRSK